MSYEKIRIRKLQQAGVISQAIGQSLKDVLERKQEQELATLMKRNYDSLEMVSGNNSDLAVDQKLSAPTTYLPMTKKVADISNLSLNGNKIEGLNITDQEVTPEEMFGGTSKQDFKPSGPSGNKMQKASMAMGIIGEAAVAAVNQVDNATMGDKNFSASSQAIDQAVHGVSGALMKSGNPYAMAAGVALEGINFATKAGGQNVQGYNVDINNSGYGNLGHQESEAGRVWDKWSGVTAQKLKKRNEKARMALAAADISSNQAFEQEARANSVTNVLQQNQIALAGGIDTSLLSS